MIVPDVNLLFYAHCPPAIHHEPARDWLERVMNGSQEVREARTAGNLTTDVQLGARH